MLPSAPGVSRPESPDKDGVVDFSPVQLIIVLLIVLIVFGAKRLPELGRNLGAGAREFKDGITGHHDESEGEAISGPATREDEKVG
jgi:sec-independent protein translocase protein TatA